MTVIKKMKTLLSWRSEKLNDFYKNKLDPVTSDKKGKRMRQPRVYGSPTKRPAPLRHYKDCPVDLALLCAPCVSAASSMIRYGTLQFNTNDCSSWLLLILSMYTNFTTNQAGHVILQAQI